MLSLNGVIVMSASGEQEPVKTARRKPAKKSTNVGRKLPVLFNCSKCPAYCCSYDRIGVTRRDVARLAKHFGITYKQAEKRYTKIAFGDLVLRHKKDHIFKKVCQFLDSETRRCTVYEGRPGVCRV